MTPQTYTIPMHAARTIRWTLCRGLLLLLATGMKLSLKLLSRDHPTRVFTEGRLAESMPAVTRSLDRGRVRSYLGEVAVSLTLIVLAWGIIDFVLDLMLGHFELLPLLFPH